MVAISAGARHSLALCSDGSLVSWGENNPLYRQLGDGSTTNRSTPVFVRTSSDSALFGKSVVAVSAGGFHTLALCSDGSLATWGDDAYGQLGDGFTTQQATPVALNTSSGSGLFGKSVTDIAAGVSHSMALCTDGSLVAWGENSYGQLGDGSTTQRTIAVTVNTSSGSALFGKSIADIAAGGAHSMALCTDGSLAAWGLNGSGQLGDGSSTNRTSPVAVNTSGSSALANKSIWSISGGGHHSIALCSDGSLAAWGLNDSGQLGDGSSTNLHQPHCSHYGNHQRLQCPCRSISQRFSTWLQLIPLPGPILRRFSTSD